MTIIKRRAEAIFDVIDGQMTICDMRSGELFELNDTGKAIWEFCDGRSKDEIISHLCALYSDINSEMLSVDVQAYLTILQQVGLAETME